MANLTNSTVFQRALYRALLLLVLPLWGCSPGEQPFHFTRFAMDTVIEYTIVAPEKRTAREQMLRAQQEIERVEHLLGEDDSLSEIYRFNHSPGGIRTNREVSQFIRRALGFYWEEVDLDLTASRGSFDITIKPVLNLYHFKADHPVPPTAEQVRRALEFVGADRLKLAGDAPSGEYRLEKPDSNMAIGVGGLAKGYAVDEAIRVLRQAGVTQALINAGGDLYCLGSKPGGPWKIGIQNPVETSEIVKVLQMADAAVATSGNYQRYFMYRGRRYHHILDPATGWPAGRAQSATVIAPTTEQADAWATILFIRSAPDGIALLNKVPGISGMVIDAAGGIHYSDGFRQFLDPVSF